ncbi:RNA helicase, DEAD-box type, Q motif protein [Balamuthia mandrillaris]
MQRGGFPFGMGLPVLVVGHNARRLTLSFFHNVPPPATVEINNLVQRRFLFGGPLPLLLKSRTATRSEVAYLPQHAAQLQLRNIVSQNLSISQRVARPWKRPNNTVRKRKLEGEKRLNELVKKSLTRAVVPASSQPSFRKASDMLRTSEQAAPLSSPSLINEASDSTTTSSTNSSRASSRKAATNLKKGASPASSRPQERKTWKALGLCKELLQALDELYLRTPTNVQTETIPDALKRKDILLAAQTGTGKTLAYLLPIFQLLSADEKKLALAGEKAAPRVQRPRAVVLLPTRELAQQVLQVAKPLSHHCKARVRYLSSSHKRARQLTELEQPVDILITTPGCLLKHLEAGSAFLSDVKYVAIDEADTMFGKGFDEELDNILVPIKKRMASSGDAVQFILATATLTPHLAKTIMTLFPWAQQKTIAGLHKPVTNLNQRFVPVGQNKQEALVTALHKEGKVPTLVFCNTIASARSTEHFLSEQGFNTANYHSGIPPKKRAEEFGRFVDGDAQILVCTDIGSRGLDTRKVQHVIMFDFPSNPIDYLHRVGRTARAGGVGTVTSLVAKKDKVFAKAIQSAITQNVSLENIVFMHTKK